MPGVLPTPLLTTGGGGVAFTVTARHSGNSATTAGQTLTTNSTTPTANSLFLTCWTSQNNSSATAPSFQTPTGGGYTYTQVAVAGVTPSYPWDGDDSFRIGGAVYRAAVGGSPSAHTVVVDSSSTTATFFYGAVCLDITGHDTSSPIVGTPAFTGSTKAQGNTETGSVTLGATPSVGNLVIVMFGAGADSGGGFATPTAGAGKTLTAVTNQTTGFNQTGVFYRIWDGSESNTITCSDLGQTVGNFTAIAFEVAAASGGGITGTAAVTGAGDTSSASGQLGYSGTSATTEAADTPSASGTVVNPITGTAAVTQANQTASASGQLGYTGTVARTQANQTSAASGQLGYSGTTAVTQAAQTASASGTFTAGGSFAGTAAVTQANQTSTASGQLGYSGTAARTQANQTAAASGTVVNPVTGTASPTQANQFSTASGILQYTGTLARTQANQTAAASGLVIIPITGTVSVIQANQFATASGVNQPLVSFGTSSAGVGVTPSSHPNTGLAPFSAPATASTPSASAAAGGVPTSTGA